MLALGRHHGTDGVLTEQFKIAELARKEAALPRLRTEVLKYSPAACSGRKRRCGGFS
jgi:hypothetical protein